MQTRYEYEPAVKTCVDSDKFIRSVVNPVVFVFMQGFMYRKTSIVILYLQVPEVMCWFAAFVFT